MRLFYRLLHIFFFTRAASKGPNAFLKYEVRRQARRAVYQATRGPRRRRG